MSENLNLLRQKYCRPGSFTGKRIDHLFPLEEKCEEGKALLATVSKTLLHLQEFDPYGLRQTYRDEASGAELPLFAVFDLEGSHQLAFEIATDVPARACWVASTYRTSRGSCSRSSTRRCFAK